VHSHYSQSDLSHVAQNIITLKLLPTYDIVLNLLSETAAVCILHHNVDHIVFNEGLNEFDESGSLEYPEKLNFIFRAFLIFFAQVHEIDGFECIFLSF
jgi:hypothetical protein